MKQSSFIINRMPGALLIVFLVFISSFLFSFTLYQEIPREALVSGGTPEGSSPAKTGMIVERATRAVTLGNGGFSPLEGNNTTVFKFAVTYYNGDGIEAADHDIIIDSIPYEMVHVSGTPVSGSVYEYRTTLSMGAHVYRFHFPPMLLPENGNFTGP